MSIKERLSRLGYGRILFSLFLMGTGLFFIVFGEYDDSPGGQMLGLIIAVYGYWRLRAKKKPSPKD